MIIAVDFDGVLCKDEFPDIGSPNYEVINLVHQLIDQGHEVILWTSRFDRLLDEAVEWCKLHGLQFTGVNCNAPSNLKKYGTDPRKIFADVYIDDRDCQCYNLGKDTTMGQSSIIDELRKGVELWKTKVN